MDHTVLIDSQPSPVMASIASQPVHGGAASFFMNCLLLTGGVLAMAISRRDSSADRTMTPVQKAEVKRAVEQAAGGTVDLENWSFKSLLRIVQGTGWKPTQQMIYLVLVAGLLKDRILADLDGIATVIEKLGRTGLSPEDAAPLTAQILEKDSGRRSSSSYHLGRLIAEMTHQKYSSDQQKALLTDLLEITKGSFEGNCERLQGVLEKFRDSGLDTDQVRGLAIATVAIDARNRSSSYYHLGRVIQALKSARIGPKSIERLLKFTIEGAFDSTDRMFERLENVLDAVKSSGWGWKLGYHLLCRVARSADEADYAFYAETHHLAAVMKSLGWDERQQYLFLTELRKRMGWLSPEEIRQTSRTLRWALDVMQPVKVWNAQEKWDTLMGVIRRCGRAGAAKAVILFAQWLVRLPEPQMTGVRECSYRLLDHLTDYNRDGVLDLMAGHRDLWNRLKPRHLIEHLSLYAELAQSRPRQILNLAEGLIEATEAGLIPADLPAAIGRVVHFIEQTNGFIPALYRAFLDEGDSLFEDMRGDVRKILNDAVSLGELREWIEQDGEEYVLGIIGLASPLSGATYVKREEQLNLLRASVDAGSVRHHIPTSWVGRPQKFWIPYGQWDLREGEAPDPEGNILELLQGFRAWEDQEVAAREEFGEILRKHLEIPEGGKDRPSLEVVQRSLYRLTGQDYYIAEQIRHIPDAGYTALGVLGQLFDDPDGIPKLLNEALAKLPETLLAGKGKYKPLRDDPSGLVASLCREWGKDAPVERRRQTVGSILRNFDPNEVESKICGRADLPDDLKQAIRETAAAVPALRREEVANQILKRPREMIRAERAKYRYRETGMMQIGVRPVKGATYALSGLTSGVCTWADLRIYLNPSYQLLAVTASDLVAAGVPLPDSIDPKQVVGYCDLFEVGLKNHLVLLGMNPSIEFLSIVDPKLLFQGLLQSTLAYAKIGGFRSLVMPTSKDIHSNRSDFQRLIKKSGWPVVPVPSIPWKQDDHRPSILSFTEAYEIWKK